MKALYLLAAGLVVFGQSCGDPEPERTVSPRPPVESGSPATGTPNGSRQLPTLNGDGRMELALSQRYYEGAAVTFHELKKDGSFPEVLGSGCGA